MIFLLFVNSEIFSIDCDNVLTLESEKRKDFFNIMEVYNLDPRTEIGTNAIGGAKISFILFNLYSPNLYKNLMCL